MKPCLILLLLLGWLSVAAADDVADAKAAFAQLQLFQKTDDPRALDLFATNCTVVYTVKEAGKVKTVYVPPASFLDGLRKSIAQKLGSRDTYEHVKFTTDGFSVNVSTIVYHPETGQHGPFSLRFERDHNGLLKIYEVKAVISMTATNSPASPPVHQP